MSFCVNNNSYVYLREYKEARVEAFRKSESIKAISNQFAEAIAKTKRLEKNILNELKTVEVEVLSNIEKLTSSNFPWIHVDALRNYRCFINKTLLGGFYFYDAKMDHLSDALRFSEDIQNHSSYFVREAPRSLPWSEYLAEAQSIIKVLSAVVEKTKIGSFPNSEWSYWQDTIDAFLRRLDTFYFSDVQTIDNRVSELVLKPMQTLQAVVRKKLGSDKAFTMKEGEVAQVVRQFDWQEFSKVYTQAERCITHNSLIKNFHKVTVSLEKAMERHYENSGWLNLSSFILSTCWLVAKKISLFAALKFLFFVDSREALSRDLVKAIKETSSSWPTARIFSQGSEEISECIPDYYLYFDTLERQFFWESGEGGLDPCRYSRLVKMNCDSSGEFRYESRISAENWDLISNSEGLPDDYDQRLQTLVSDYKTALDNAISGRAIDANNVFHALSNGTLLLSYEAPFFPMIFPKALIDRCKVEIERFLESKNLINDAVKLRYQLDNEGGLLIVAQSSYADKRADFLKIQVHDFDLRAIKSYGSDSKRERRFKKEEFLFLSMYGPLVGLGAVQRVETVRDLPILTKERRTSTALFSERLFSSPIGYGNVLNFDQVLYDIYVKSYQQIDLLSRVYSGRSEEEIHQELKDRFQLPHPSELFEFVNDTPNRLKNNILPKEATLESGGSVLFQPDKYREWLFEKPSGRVKELERLKGELTLVREKLVAARKASSIGARRGI